MNPELTQALALLMQVLQTQTAPITPLLTPALDVRMPPDPRPVVPALPHRNVSPTRSMRSAAPSLAPTTTMSVASVVPTTHAAQLADANAKALSERDLVRRLCHLLQPTPSDLFPSLLRACLLVPEEVTSSPNLRGKLLESAKQFAEENPLLLQVLLAGTNTAITVETLLADASPLAQEVALLAASLLARTIGRWAILGRVDMWRTKRRMTERMNSAELVLLLAELGETWLLGDQLEHATSAIKRPRVELMKK